jgi:metal-responsive CopG/Arc/MetJ family transcriptional regulator
MKKNTRILLEIPEEMLKEIDSQWREHGFTSRQEYLRFVLREHLFEMARFRQWQNEKNARSSSVESSGIR